MTVPFEFVGIKGGWFTAGAGSEYTLMDLPANLEVGDLMLAAGYGAGPDFLRDPAGWNVSRAWPTDPNSTLYGLYWKVVTQADLDWPFVYFNGSIFAYRGVDRVLEAGGSVSQAGIRVQFEAVQTTFPMGAADNLPLDVMGVPTRYVKDGVGFASTYGRSYYVEGWMFGCCHKPLSPAGVEVPAMSLGGVTPPASLPFGLQAAIFVLASGPGPGAKPRGLTMFM